MGKSKNLFQGILFIVLVTSFTIILSIPEKGSSRMSRHERQIIRKSGEVMYVLNVANREDSIVLRSKCDNFTEKDLESVEFANLVRKMLTTVQSPEQGGVGIAGPQVGITHRIIAVCRMDKEGEPFEVYPNIRIDSLYGDINVGPEGCLSIAPYRGNVPRYSDIDIVYKDRENNTEVREHVSGYTAIIFQHECDHLDGILYTDRADSVYVNESWLEERKEFEDKGLYDKPAWMEK